MRSFVFYGKILGWECVDWWKGSTFARVNRSVVEKMKKELKKKYLLPAAICLFALMGVAYYYFFSSVARGEKVSYLYVDKDDTYDSLIVKLRPLTNSHGLHAFSTLSRHSPLTDRVRPGRYAVRPGMGALTLFRRLKNGMQTPLSLTLPSVRTVEDLSGFLGRKLLADSTSWLQTLRNEKVCQQLGYDTATVVAMIVPNTYDVYWTVSPEALLQRLRDEHDRWWNGSRSEKARQLGLTPVEVCTLASIVDEETANTAEKPMVAGMYYNRLQFRSAEYPEGMPLQADPTIKFAWKQFGLKRIYQKLLSINSPYNTYRRTGLPPGPIRVASTEGIDAVLNMVHHSYLYMCAKEDFSGTHNFAVTYQEHLANAARYAKALNARGIK